MLSVELVRLADLGGMRSARLVWQELNPPARNRKSELKKMPKDADGAAIFAA